VVEDWVWIEENLPLDELDAMGDDVWPFLLDFFTKKVSLPPSFRVGRHSLPQGTRAFFFRWRGTEATTATRSTQPIHISSARVCVTLLFLLCPSRRLLQLPDEVLVHMLSFASARTLAQFSLTCHHADRLWFAQSRWWRVRVRVRVRACACVCARLS
jgi:hypothetical protein